MLYRKKKLLKKIIKYLTVIPFITIILFLAVEGLSELIILIYFISPPMAERTHTRYDKEIGWINIPNIQLDNQYGHGIYLKTNSQGYRNHYDFGYNIPKDKIRIICSGDSFTLGYGVDNDHTWCQLLSSNNNQIETVNMGQGGYGIDQAYLLYLRNNTILKHDIHIFAFIFDDFNRMQKASFSGHPKPWLSLERGEIVINNIPVPVFSLKKYVFNMSKNINGLNSMQIINFIMNRSQEQAVPISLDKTVQTDEQTFKILSKIFKTLNETGKENGSSLVLVLLPTLTDYMYDFGYRWREFVHHESENQHIIFIDLIDDFRSIEPTKVNSMFRMGHYSETGNDYIASILFEKLCGIPELSHKISNVSEKQ